MAADIEFSHMVPQRIWTEFIQQLRAMAYDTFVLEQTIDVAPGEARYPVEIEIKERDAEVRAFRQDGAPTQSGLETLQAQFLEQATIVADREAPLGIVIGEGLRCAGTPAASRLAVRS